MVKIEKDIPFPDGPRRPGEMKYPFLAEMNVGDSVYIEGENSQGKTMISARNYSLKSGKKFISRSEDAGVRIWRSE